MVKRNTIVEPRIMTMLQSTSMAQLGVLNARDEKVKLECGSAVVSHVILISFHVNVFNRFKKI